MGKKAFLFPGQGSQEIGMGADLFREDAFFRSLVNCAGDIVHEDLEKLCLKGPERTLMQARFLQPLLVSVCLGYLRGLSDRGVVPDIVLGHSLGEITSLAAAGIVDAQEAVRIATRRGELMDEAASRCSGGMLAVMFVPISQIESMLDEAGEPECIVLANDNAPDQIVLSGDLDLLDKFARRLAAEHIGKCKKVQVAGPWHSPYLRSAREQFENWAEPIKFHKPHTPIILNATAKPEYHPTTIKHLVTWQLTSPVFWRESMTAVREMGVNTIYEVGPGRVLSGLARVNGMRKETTIYNINNLRGLETAVAAEIKTAEPAHLSLTGS